MYPLQEQENPSTALSPSQDLTDETVIYLNNDGTIHSLNSSACRLLNVDTKTEAEGHNINDFIHFSLESITKVYKSFFEGTFTNSNNTIIPSVNARFSYTFSFDSEKDAVKLILRENPFI